jgi:NAD(P)-dependent dehydrogenase (short-subunit alcohol dehydrogenase family)
MAPRVVRGSTVVVTGATSGIGRETALAFASAGANVVVAGRRVERLQELVDTIGPDAALAVPTDVADETQVTALIANAVARFTRVDVLVNNAGIGAAARFGDLSLAEFRRIMDVNFWGAVHACRAAVPRMKSQPGGGVIMNVSSILGKRGMPFETAYCASKFALAGFSEALRTEVMADGIDVTTIFPGAVESEIWESATNRTGLDIPDTLPKLPARELARAIVENARFPRPEIVMSLDAQLIDVMNTVAPGVIDFVVGQSLPFIDGFRRGFARPAAPVAAGDSRQRRGTAGG